MRHTTCHVMSSLVIDSDLALISGLHHVKMIHRQSNYGQPNSPLIYCTCSTVTSYLNHWVWYSLMSFITIHCHWQQKTWQQCKFMPYRPSTVTKRTRTNCSVSRHRPPSPRGLVVNSCWTASRAPFQLTMCRSRPRLRNQTRKFFHTRTTHTHLCTC